MPPPLTLDVAVVGGGITGLWLLNRLRHQGYSALLIEATRLGQGQSMLSQGLIHGNISYRLPPVTEPADLALDEQLLATWQACLSGTGDIDLSAVRRLSPCQYLWLPPPRRRWWWPVQPALVAPPPGVVAVAADGPVALQQPRFEGCLYRFEQPVLDCASLLGVLAEPQREVIVLNQGAAMLSTDGTLTLRTEEREPLVLRPRYCVFTAGTGNTALLWAPLRLRPLRMILVRGNDLPVDLYLHWLESGPWPRLTLTSHRDAAGRTVWYLGGQVAERGLQRRPQALLQEARQLLKRLLPQVALTGAQFALLPARRVETQPSQPENQRQRPLGVFQSGKLIAAWPTQLTQVPPVVDNVLKLLQKDKLRPSPADLGPLADWPRPKLADYPWEDGQLSWT